MVNNSLSTPVNFVHSMYITHIINIEQLVRYDLYTNNYIDKSMHQQIIILFHK